MLERPPSAQGAGRGFLRKGTGMQVTQARTSDERINETAFSHRAEQWERGLDVMEGGPEFLKGGGGSC